VLVQLPYSHDKRQHLCRQLVLPKRTEEIILEQEHQAGKACRKSSRSIRASVGFVNLANIVSKSWWNISPAHKEELEKQVKLEKER
jgi:uncharacterized membrane protein